MPVNSIPIIVLTGGLASGKSTAAKLLEAMGCKIIDTDVIAKSLLQPGSPCFQAVVDHFGPSILEPSGSIHRRKLRKIIFKAPQDKKFLEDLLHPRIRQVVYEQVQSLKNQSHPSRALVILVPLLTSKESYPADKIITIEASPELQIERAMARDGISRELATRMIESQPSAKQRQALADRVIWNEGNPEQLQKQLSEVFDLAKGLFIP